MDFTIEQIKSADVNRIQNLAYQTWPDTFQTILSEDQIDYMLKWMYNLETLSEQIEKGHLFFILRSTHEDLGFIGIEANYPVSKTFKIHKLYVLPNQQGKGIGLKLIEHAEKMMQHDFDQEYAVLNVNRFNKATSFYTKIGFEVIKEEDIEIGNGYLMEDFVMQKKVDTKK